MRIGITGAGGLLGTSLIERLRKQPAYAIRALTRRAPAPDDGAVDWQVGDLADPQACAKFVAGLDVVFHLAHSNSPLTSDTDWVGDAQANLLPSLSLLAAIERAGTRPHFIYPSSGGAIYGLAKERVPFAETAPCYPGNSYGIQKLMIEQYLRLFAERGLLQATVLRIGNAYGWLLAPERMQGFIGTAINRIRLGQPVRLVGDPGNVRDYIHVDDVVEALLRVVEYRAGFDVFNIGTGQGASVTDILAILSDLLGRPVATEQMPLRAAGLLPSWSVLDVSKARTLLGWQPQVPLAQGIARMLVVAEG